jgi:hypothetical protein
LRSIHRDGKSNTNSYTNSYTNSDADTHTNPNANTNTGAKPIAFTKSFTVAEPLAASDCFGSCGYKESTGKQLGS